MDPSHAELAIRLRRATFNRAIAAADAAAIAPILAADAILVTGTDSAIISGRKAQLIVWRREFAASARTTYSRITETVIVSPAAPIALEQGRWQGVGADGHTDASGTYTAKWRAFGADWMIEAEIYLTLA